MENRPFSIPTGEAFLVSTPNLDKVAQRIYQDQKLREQRHYAEGKILDDEYAKNMSGMRDADIPDYGKAYNDFKSARIGLMKKGNNVTPQDQLDVLAKKAAMFKIAAQSKQEKENEELYQKDYLKNPDKYNDGANNFFIERRRTPVSQFQINAVNPKTGSPIKIDMADIEGNTKYQLGNTDFTKDISKAKGTAGLRGGEVKEVTPDGLNTIITTYKAGNSPTEYINALQGSVVGSQKTKHLPLEFDYSDEEAAKIINDYQALKQTPEFKAAYPNEPEIPAMMFQTKTGKAMALMAMENAILHPPTPVRKREANTGAVMDKRRQEGMEDWLKKNRITDQQKKERIRLNNEGRIYEIDNVPLKLKTAAKIQPSIFGGIEATDVTDWSDAELGDVLGTKTDKYGQRLRQPIEVAGKKYIKIVPNGFEVRDADGKPVVIEDKEVIVNTDKRTRGLEKPIGTGKAQVRGEESIPKVKTTTKSGLPVFHP